MLEVELFRNGSKFCTCYVSYRSAIGVILESSTEQTPSIVLQAPSYPVSVFQCNLLLHEAFCYIFQLQWFWAITVLLANYHRTLGVCFAFPVR